MRTDFASALLAFAVFFVSAIHAQEDAHGAKDHPTIPRFPGTVISWATQHDFGAREFTLKDGTKNVEGRIWEIQYAPKDGARVPSPLELARNYGNLFKRNGGAVLFEQVDSGGGTVTMKMPSGTVETWMEITINNNGEQFTFYIVTTTPMEQKVELSADEIGTALATTGRVALYGILFDTNKAVIKPESAALLKEIVALLKKNTALKLRIEGHTDNIGVAAANKALSEKRAQSVLAALKAEGIDTARLSATGWGSERPIAGNATEADRARNRRVELVKP